MTISFVCRASKARKDGLSPLELSVIINGNRSILALDRKCKPSQFNPKTQKVRGDKEINEYLDIIKQKCYSIQMELLKTNGDVTIDDFVDAYKNGIKSKDMTVLQCYDKHNEQYKSKVLSGMVDNTALYKYKKSRERIAAYLTSIGKEDMRLKDITPAWCEGYESYCMMDLKRGTTNKELKMLKRILAYAQREGHLTANPFQLTISEEKLDYKPLTIEEVSKLIDSKIENERISSVRDLFIFQCYTGLAYSDMASFTKEDIVDGVIIKRRKKTDVQSVIPILPEVHRILEKYDYKLPIISNQKYNAYLKVLGDTCSTRQILHSHLARHTYATILLNKGVDMKTVSRTMGHANSKITEKVYASMLNQTVVDNIMKVF